MKPPTYATVLRLARRLPAADRQRLALGLLSDTSSPPTARTIWSLGSRQYRVGTGKLVQVSNPEDDVLMALACRGALTGLELVGFSTRRSARRILAALRLKYGGAFARAIPMPRTRAGRYSADVRFVDVRTVDVVEAVDPLAAAVTR
jgi:hypothetical protein